MAYLQQEEVVGRKALLHLYSLEANHFRKSHWAHSLAATAAMLNRRDPVHSKADAAMKVVARRGQAVFNSLSLDYEMRAATFVAHFTIQAGEAGFRHLAQVLAIIRFRSLHLSLVPVATR